LRQTWLPSQPFVDEAAGLFELLRLAPLEIERRPDAGRHGKQVDRAKPFGVRIAAAKEADVLEQQVDDEKFGSLVPVSTAKSVPVTSSAEESLTSKNVSAEMRTTMPRASQGHATLMR
jgi:hypothetical protein